MSSERGADGAWQSCANSTGDPLQQPEFGCQRRPHNKPRRGPAAGSDSDSFSQLPGGWPIRTAPGWRLRSEPLAWHLLTSCWTRVPSPCLSPTQGPASGWSGRFPQQPRTCHRPAHRPSPSLSECVCCDPVVKAGLQPSPRRTTGNVLCGHEASARLGHRDQTEEEGQRIMWTWNRVTHAKSYPKSSGKSRALRAGDTCGAECRRQSLQGLCGQCTRGTRPAGRGSAFQPPGRAPLAGAKPGVT